MTNINPKMDETTEVRSDVETEALSNPSVYQQVVTTIVEAALQHSQLRVDGAIRSELERLQYEEFQPLHQSLSALSKKIGLESDDDSLTAEEVSITQVVQACIRSLEALEAKVTEMDREIKSTLSDLPTSDGIKGEINKVIEIIDKRQSKAEATLRTSIVQLREKVAVVQKSQSHQATSDDDKAAVALMMSGQRTTRELVTTDLSKLRQEMASAATRERRLAIFLALAIASVLGLQVAQFMIR